MRKMLWFSRLNSSDIHILTQESLGFYQAGPLDRYSIYCLEMLRDDEK